jgi:oligopeptide transport system permease protein
MIAFLLRRLCWFAVTLWVVLSLSFVIMRAVPGGPFSAERAVDALVERNLKARYHLDWPLWRQYLHYVGPLNLDQRGLVFGDGSRPLGGVLCGDLGPSFRYVDFTVVEVIAQSLPLSLQLGILALFWALLLGLSAGLAAALRPRSVLDHVLRVLSTLGIALPNFVIAGLLLLLFAMGRIDLGTLDVGSLKARLAFTLPALAPVAGHGSFAHLVLPSLALGLPFAAYVARLFRTALLETLAEDYVRTAVAKGLPTWLVVRRHALPNALRPVLSFLGPAAAGILTGSLVIERIFYIPGTGSHFVNSALNRDYTLAMGLTLLYTVLVFALNMLVDVVYTALDPRLRLEEA